MVETDAVAVCSVCDMPHHLSCWQDHLGSYKTRFARYEPAHCHMELSAGTPNGSTKVYDIVTYPNGQSSEGSFDGSWYDGGSGQIWWDNGISSSGHLYVDFHDHNNNLIGSRYVYIHY